MTNPDIVGSAGSIGMYADPSNRRYRGLADGFVPTVESLFSHWRQLLAEAQHAQPPVSRRTLRAVTTPQVAAQAALHTTVEAFLPLTTEAGLLYIAANDPDRQTQLPLAQMQQTIDTVAAAVQSRWRPPAERLAQLDHRGYRFTAAIPQHAELENLWGPTFGWNRTQIGNLAGRLAANAQLPPEARDLWFTGVTREGQLVGAALAERLDVPGPNGPITTIESTEWRVHDSQRRNGLAAGMLALNTAQCLRDQPEACMLAECRFSTTAYAAGLSIGFALPERSLCPQILARNVWVDGELADFVPLTLADHARADYYLPPASSTLLHYLDRPTA